MIRFLAEGLRRFAPNQPDGVAHLVTLDFEIALERQLWRPPRDQVLHRAGHRFRRCRPYQKPTAR